MCQPKGKRVAEKRREGGKRWGWGLGQRAVPDMGVPCRGRGDDRGVSGREGGHRIGTNGERRGGQRAPFRKPCAALAQNRDGWQEPESGRQACAYTDCGQRARRPDVCGMGSRRPRREVGPIRARTAQGERRRAPFRSRSSTCRRGGGRTLWWKQRQTCGQHAPDMCVGGRSKRGGGSGVARTRMTEGRRRRAPFRSRNSIRLRDGWQGTLRVGNKRVYTQTVAVCPPPDTCVPRRGRGSRGCGSGEPAHAHGRGRRRRAPFAVGDPLASETEGQGS